MPLKKKKSKKTFMEAAASLLMILSHSPSMLFIVLQDLDDRIVLKKNANHLCREQNHRQKLKPLQSPFPLEQVYAATNFFRFFNHIKYSLLSLLIMYSCKKLVVLGLIPLISKYLWKAFCKFSSKSLSQEEVNRFFIPYHDQEQLNLIQHHFIGKEHEMKCL